MPCILTPTNLIGVSRHYTVYPLIVQVNLFCGGGMGLFCERGTSFWRKNSPSRALPPRKPLTFSCPAAQSARRDGCALRGTMGLFLREEDFFLEKELPLSRSPPRKPLGVSCPAAQSAPGRMRLPENATKPHPPPPSGGGCGQAVSFGGGPGGTLPFPKGRVPPGVTSPKS